MGDGDSRGGDGLSVCGSYGRQGGRWDNGGSNGRNRHETGSDQRTHDDACSKIDTNQALVDSLYPALPHHGKKITITAAPATTRDRGEEG